MKGSLKGLYSFIICDCSNAGVWVKDLEIASVYIGQAISEKEFKDAFLESNKLVDLGNGKYFLPDFIEYQYPKGLSKANPAHIGVISELLKFNLLDENLKGLWRDSVVPTIGTMDKDKGTDKGKGKEKEKGTGAKHLFSESEFYNFDKFELQFIGTEYESADLRFYYEAVKNWSASGGNTKVDWIATARNFIIKDIHDKKLKLQHGATTKTPQQEQFERISKQFERERKY